MKNRISFLVLIGLLIIFIPSFSQDTIKKGIAFGGVPVMSFDSDLGFRYGISANIFDYGDGQKFPKYYQNMYIRLINTTKGNTQIQSTYENYKLIKNTKISGELSYVIDKSLNFYGFNGLNSTYNESFSNSMGKDFINPYYYAYQRKLYRLKAEIQPGIGSEKFRLWIGLNYNYFNIDTVNSSSLVNHNELDSYTNSSLFENYVNNGILPESEINGGSIAYILLGLIFDNRDSFCHCSKGIFADINLIIAPNILNQSPFSRLNLTWRHYKNFFNKKLIFNYRISSQTKINGKQPFYFLPVYIDPKMNLDGLGGAYTLRGIKRNRVVSDGFLTGNFELRYRVLSMNILNISTMVEISGFSDLGYITQEYKPQSFSNFTPGDELGYNCKKQGLISTFGLGLYFIYDKNNIISVNYGISNDNQLGSTGLYIGSSYLF